MAIIYTAKVRTEGGRNGHASSSDGLLNLNLSLPKSLGGKEDATNPEQLFAVGFASCFENAVLYIARQRGQALTGTSVDGTVHLHSTAAGPFKLEVFLDVELGGLSQADAEELVHAADAVCPYSNATRGNIDVHISTAVR